MKCEHCQRELKQGESWIRFDNPITETSIRYHDKCWEWLRAHGMTSPNDPAKPIQEGPQ
jgi:hypothetical protein